METASIEITVDKNAGFCPGVRRSFGIACEVDERPACTLGQLVHNDEVSKYLLGEKNIAEISEAEIESVHEGTLIIPAHGATTKNISRAQEKGLNIIDATCVHIKRIFNAVESLRNQGYQILIIGDPEHTEIKAIKSRSGADAVVIPDTEQARKFLPSGKKIAAVSQTTINRESVKQIVSALQEKCPDIKLEDTFCGAVNKTQSSARQLAKSQEIVIVVGDDNSRNSVELKKIALSENPRTYFIDNASKLKPEWLKGIRKIGISAGASTPSWTIEEVIDKIREITVSSEL